MFAMLSAIRSFLFRDSQHRREVFHVDGKLRFADFLDPLRFVVGESNRIGEILEFTFDRPLVKVEKFVDAGVGDPLLPVEVRLLRPIVV